MENKFIDGLRRLVTYEDDAPMWPIQKAKHINLWVVYLYYEKNFFWIRLFNNWYGIKGSKISAKRFVLWSERNGFRRTFKLFGWRFTILKPFPMKYK